ncbi:MAG: DEAD/DEAH box helicase, partial [Bacteroidota bacterium]
MNKKTNLEKNQNFLKLNQSVKNWILDRNWIDLNPIQNIVIPEIQHKKENRDIIVAAPTATGKTEAVFLPIASNYLDNYYDVKEGAGALILYVCPLKALINQQSKRLSELFPTESFPIIPWHGETSKGKKSFEKKPFGMVVITPESLESQLMKGSSRFRSLYENLRFVVIDELHSFFNSPRGIQLISQLSRIESILSRRVQRIGLSATFNKSDKEVIKAVKEFLRPANNDNTLFLVDEITSSEINYAIKCGYQSKEENNIYREIYEDFVDLEKDQLI